MSESRLKLVSDQETHLLDAALAIAEERENNTQRLAQAVLDDDLVTAKRIAKELLPNAQSNRIDSSFHRRSGR